ncbi:hypothetical protein BaRGS_00013522 [Batillaria attramentaria]|uniref:Uncharacterized protein n=1 Tax=Batillaria attramentaria TaxID=370345 RepID=A0ABD0L850_9CAEN
MSSTDSVSAWSQTEQSAREWRRADSRERRLLEEMVQSSQTVRLPPSLIGINTTKPSGKSPLTPQSDHCRGLSGLHHGRQLQAIRWTATGKSSIPVFADTAAVSRREGGSTTQALEEHQIADLGREYINGGGAVCRDKVSGCCCVLTISRSSLVGGTFHLERIKAG